MRAVRKSKIYSVNLQKQPWNKMDLRVSLLDGHEYNQGFGDEVALSFFFSQFYGYFGDVAFPKLMIYDIL